MLRYPKKSRQQVSCYVWRTFGSAPLVSFVSKDDCIERDSISRQTRLGASLVMSDSLIYIPIGAYCRRSTMSVENTQFSERSRLASSTDALYDDTPIYSRHIASLYLRSRLASSTDALYNDTPIYSWHIASLYLRSRLASSTDAPDHRT
jgi:hypothetical protein